MITGKNVSKIFDERSLFSNITFKITGSKKIGLVGRNGCGKTTLFKMITGNEDITEGSIDISNEDIGYIPQEFTFPSEMVGIYLEKQLKDPWEYYKIDTLISQLNIENYDPYQDISTMSEGQKMKIKLTEILLKEPTSLFIDEPTNHLDMEGIEWFERYIKSLKIPVIMISHDRAFLNNVVDEIWEIERDGLIRYVGNYDYYKEEKFRLIDKWNTEFKAQEKKRAQLERLLENVKKIGDGKKRSKAVSAAKTRISRLEKEKKEKYVSKVMNSVNIDTEIHRSKLMLKMTDVTKSYGKNTVFSNLNLELRGGEKVWLFGPNGAGKSTLVKIITGIEAVDSGEVKLGNDISVGYFSQIQPKIKTNDNLLDHFIARTGCYFGSVFKYLDKFLFKNEDLKKGLNQLSPGERARFEFAIFAYKDYDMLILDEPDNHLDIETKEVLERSLSEYKGTMLLVSHDRYFVGNCGITGVLNLKNGILKST